MSNGQLRRGYKPNCKHHTLFSWKFRLVDFLALLRLASSPPYLLLCVREYQRTIAPNSLPVFHGRHTFIISWFSVSSVKSFMKAFFSANEFSLIPLNNSELVVIVSHDVFDFFWNVEEIHCLEKELVWYWPIRLSNLFRFFLLLGWCPRSSRHVRCTQKSNLEFIPRCHGVFTFHSRCH